MWLSVSVCPEFYTSDMTMDMTFDMTSDMTSDIGQNIRHDIKIIIIMINGLFLKVISSIVHGHKQRSMQNRQT